ncbi:MAG: outer membrane protein assembly factor BamA [Thermoanaerobaculia bacterium]
MAVPAVAGPAGAAARRSCGAARRAVLALALLLAGRPAASQTEPTPTPTPAPATLDLRPGGSRPQGASPLAGALPPTLNLGAAPSGRAETIAEIAVRGGKTVTAETIGFYLGVKVGDRYDADQLGRAFPKLWESGLFEDLRLEKESAPGGVRVVAVVVERPRVADLEFRGNKKLTTSQLKDKLKEGKVEIRVGAPVSLRDVSKGKSVLTEAYRAEGFRSAVVDANVEAMGENERRVVFLVDEGDKVKIDDIVFTGNTVFSDRRLYYAMKKTRKTNFYQFWDSKDVYNQANYEEDIESVKKVYQNAGYKDVVVKDPVVSTFIVNPRETRPDKVKRRARIEVPIVEGERYYFGSVKVEGATIFPPERLVRFFGWEEGKPLNRSVLADGMKTIDEIYRGRGYIYAFMNPEYVERPGKGNLVDVTVRITEGDQFRVGRVEFTGNKTTKDKVLRRELQLFEGDVLDMESFKKGLFKITQLGYFKIEEDPEFRVNPEKKTVDVTVKGIDTNRNEIQFGAGYSQLDGVFGQFQFSTRNFLGRGDTIGVQFQRGGRSNYFDLSFVEPWFLDKRMSIGGSVYNRSLDYSDVNQRTRGLNLSVGQGLGLFDGVSLIYAFTDTQSRYQIYPPPVPPGGAVPPNAYADYLGKTSAIAPGYRYDSRNDPFDPTRGRRFALNVTIAGGPLGGDFSFVKPIANGTVYFNTTRRSHIALNLEGGYVAPYSGQQIPIYERFRIGGDRSVRGFAYGSIYPLNDQDQPYFNDQGALLGGDKYMVFNLEAVYYLVGPLKLVAFFDAGNAWIEEQSFNPLKLRMATGAELRMFLPIFQAPLRFIYGINLDPKTITYSGGRTLTVEKRSDFQFSIGTTF